jgi:4-hydroxy-tetrahydrodipicolinate reductase
MKLSRVRVLLIGASGRMGKTIVDLAKKDPMIDIAARCDLGDSIELVMQNCDVAIDFSQADAIAEICRVTLEHSKPLVIGTTGQSNEQRRIIEETAQSLPIVFASNFSIGVNVLFWLTRKAAEQLGSDFDAEIVETHHKMKKDAPSGTAKTLAEVLKAAKKTQAEIPVQSIREGDVVGEHTVIFNGPAERLGTEYLIVRRPRTVRQ